MLKNFKPCFQDTGADSAPPTGAEFSPPLGLIQPSPPLGASRGKRKIKHHKNQIT